MKTLLSIALLFLIGISNAFSAANTATVSYRTNDYTFSPRDLLSSNVYGAGGITIVKLPSGFLVISNNLLSLSNGIISAETVRNAAVSNALAALLVVNDNITSNGLSSASSNGVKVAAGAGGITVSSSGAAGVQTFTVGAGGSGPSSTMTVVGTNLIADATSFNMFTNYIVSIAGGVTNMLWSNLAENSIVHSWFWVSNGVTVVFPQFNSNDYGPEGAPITPNTNGWTHVIVEKHGLNTNITVFTPGFELLSGVGVTMRTNYAARQITFEAARYTNYPTGALTINCGTDVRAQITNAVASNYAITLSTPVIGTGGTLGMVSDGSARILSILCSSASMTWLSTNDTSNATNILTSASKRAMFAWRVGMATDGVSTNIQLWVKNQTP